MEESASFSFSCTWFNPDDHEVTYGGSANDEMCFVFGYYYPAESFPVCL
jgi:hypothetical protein